jgi:predicted carbohydrate-binding protein with CBM5 and CBM33 domain
LLNRTWLLVLRGYVAIAAALVLMRIAQFVAAHHYLEAPLNVSMPCTLRQALAAAHIQGQE